MEIKNCTPNDLPVILELYQAARALQSERKMVVWPSFSEEYLLAEINELRQFKIMLNHAIACNWAITFSDLEIWGDKDLKDSIFIHRICTHPQYRGNRNIDHIVEWAKIYAKQQGKSYVRLDTLGQNDKLIRHYTSAGFHFLGIHRLTNTATLPKHYQDEPNCCLFEIKL